jgi:dCMP deaminase
MQKITINPNRISLDEAYLQMAEVWSKRSKANRMQVGAIIVKNNQIISDGYNGLPAGCDDDVCEEFHNGELRTKKHVLHAEANAITKLAENGGVGSRGATMYCTCSPCIDCAKLIVQSKIKRVIFRHLYRNTDGIELLNEYGIETAHFNSESDLQSKSFNETQQNIVPTLPISETRLNYALPLDEDDIEFQRLVTQANISRNTKQYTESTNYSIVTQPGSAFSAVDSETEIPQPSIQKLAFDDTEADQVIRAFMEQQKASQRAPEPVYSNPQTTPTKNSSAPASKSPTYISPFL